jgi:hypothetical protein
MDAGERDMRVVHGHVKRISGAGRFRTSEAEAFVNLASATGSPVLVALRKGMLRQRCEAGSYGNSASAVSIFASSESDPHPRALGFSIKCTVTLKRRIILRLKVRL